MNKKYRALALVLSMLTLSSCGIFKNFGKNKDTTPKINSEYIYNGTHVYTATDRNDYLVKNGRTDYTLVIPSESSASMRVARSEFVDLFKDATGIAINVVTDDKVANAAQGRYISLGRTSLLENSGIKMDKEELTADGHKIVTKDDDVYLCGGADEGTVFSVYTFMRLTFNYETYAYNCMEIEHTSEKKLKDYDVIDIPDFKYRAHSSDVTTYESFDYDENMFAWRLNYYGKEGTRGYYWMPVHEYIDDFSKGGKGASTNINRWFPEKIYKDANDLDNYHPLWFSDNGGEQVCFSAHGDPDEYEAMVDAAYQKVIAHLKHYTPDKYPRYRVMSMTHMDNTNYCTCDSCKEISTYYGDSQAAVQILFMNELAKRVDATLEANKGEAWYREDFQMLFFAYNHNYQAPARYDAVTKQYVPIDDKVIVHDRLIAWFCRNANGQGVFDEELNSTLLTTLAGWSAVAKNIYYWNYGTSFRNYMMPLETYQFATSEMYAYFCNQSDKFWFTQFQDHNKCANTAWHGLKVYLDAKLSWDTSLSKDELVTNWMKAMYKDAMPTMMRLFQSVRAYQRHVLIGEYELESNGDGSPEMGLAEYWPIGMLEGWLAMIDQAKLDVARLEKADPELYDRTCQHIEIEAISTLYILLETQGYTISAEARKEYIDRIKYDIEWLDIDNMVFRSDMYLVDWLADKEGGI